MEAKTEKIIAKKTETKVKKNRLGTFFIWLFFLSFGMLLTVGDCRTFALVAFLFFLVLIIEVPTNSKTEEAITKKTETKITTEKATTKVENKGSGTWFLWLMLSCFVILIIAGDWITLGFIAVFLIAGIEVPTKSNLTEEEKQKRYEENCKLAERISLM